MALARIIFYTALSMGPFVLTLCCAAWMMLQSPFTAPYITRTPTQIDAVLTRAMARQVTLTWLLPRMQDAILTENHIRLNILLDLANDHNITLPPALINDIATIQAKTSGLIARTTACGACAIDISACETLAQIGACAIPFELTPAGDINAVRRAGLAYAGGDDVDRLDLGLALVGLGATGATIATGGTSYTLKAASSILRLSSKLGTLTPALTRRLQTLIADAVRWDQIGAMLRRDIAPSALLNASKLDELTQLGQSLQRVANQTSVADSIVLLRHVDNAGDAARLARITEALGPRSRAAFEVLGKTRVMRATVRISNLALGAATALYLAALQVLVFGGQWSFGRCLRALRRNFT